MSSSASKTSIKDDKLFSSFIANLKLVYNGEAANAAYSSNSNHVVADATASPLDDAAVAGSPNSPKASDVAAVNGAKVQNKSKFKTIKIFVASNKNGEYSFKTNFG